MPAKSHNDEALIEKLSEIINDIEGLHSYNGTFNKEMLKEVESAAKKVKSTIHGKSKK